MCSFCNPAYTLRHACNLGHSIYSITLVNSKFIVLLLNLKITLVLLNQVKQKCVFV